MPEDKIRTVDFLNDFVDALESDLLRGEEKWGDTWSHRPREGQEERIRQYILDHFDRFRHNDTPIKWVSIAGECLIGWIRDNHPELFEE